MSACDTCRDPGACCAGFWLSLDNADGTSSGSFWDDTVPISLKGMILMAQMWLPFVPALIKKNVSAEGRPFTYISHWACPLLGEDGRCSDYANRPALCDRYEPKSSKLCVEFEG